MSPFGISKVGVNTSVVASQLGLGEVVGIFGSCKGDGELFLLILPSRMMLYYV